MVSPESVSLASDLLEEASTLDARQEDQRLERNLLVAAALREVLTRSEPIVVGGTAEDFWTSDEYHETDLDLVAWPLSDDEEALLETLGFTHEGRHWIHAATGLPVEMPEGALAGDVSRVHRERIGRGEVSIISVEDLYLDRVRQSTVDADDDGLPTYKSALAIAASNYESMDWTYVDRAIRIEKEVTPALMARIDRRVRRTTREKLSGPRRRRTRSHQGEPTRPDQR
jgi:hypothetical protein